MRKIEQMEMSRLDYKDTESMAVALNEFVAQGWEVENLQAKISHGDTNPELNLIYTVILLYREQGVVGNNTPSEYTLVDFIVRNKQEKTTLDKMLSTDYFDKDWRLKKDIIVRINNYGYEYWYQHVFLLEKKGA